MGRSGSRAVLIALAVAAIAVAGLLWALGNLSSQPEVRRSDSSETVDEPAARPALEPGAAEGRAAARADHEDASAARGDAAVPTRTLVVRGTVTDKRTGANVAGIGVQATARPPEQNDWVKTKTDELGRYSLDLQVPVDSQPPVLVFAWRDGLETVPGLLEASAFHPDPQDPRRSVAIHDIAFEVLLAVRGKLVRESDGSPIAGGGATLVALERAPRAPRPLAEATTDETGGFLIRIDAVEPGDLAVLGAARGFVAHMAPVALDPARVADVGAIALGEGACIEGVVTTADGSRPAADEVYATARKPGDNFFFMSSGGTDMWGTRGGNVLRLDARAPIGSDGRFKLCGLAPEDFSLTVAYLGCSLGSRLDQVEVRAPASGVRLELSRCVYRLKAHDARDGSRIDTARFHFDSNPNMACNLSENFVIATDPGEEHPGRIVADGYRALACTLPALAASEVRELRYELELLPKQVVATIVVLSPDGGPVVEVEAEITSVAEGDEQGPIPRLVHTAEDGRHDLPALPPGPYHVEIEPAYAIVPHAQYWLPTSIELDVREGMRPIEVRLEVGGQISATVTKVGGVPVDARTSILRGPEGKAEQIDWCSDINTYVGWLPKAVNGRLCKPLPAGTWTLRFDADLCAARDVEVRVLPGETAALQIELEPKAR